MVTVQGQGRVIANFAFTHFNAATRFAGVVGDLESKHSGEEFGDFFLDISAYCAACVVTSAASLEALINEVFLTPGPLQSAVSDFETFFWGGPTIERRWLFFSRDIKSHGLEKKGALEKYRKAVNLLSKKPLSKTDSEFENAEILFGLRNYLIHFKPLWEDNQRDQRLEEALAGRFELSPFVDEGADFLAMKCMSSGCATWATETVEHFVQYFLGRTSLFPKKLNKFRRDAASAA